MLTEFKISLAAARVNAGLTQNDVAQALKVGKQTVVSWEKGKSEPKMSQSRQLSELYKMPLDYIFLPKNQIKIDKIVKIMLYIDNGIGGKKRWR